MSGKYYAENHLKISLTKREIIVHTHLQGKPNFLLLKSVKYSNNHLKSETVIKIIMRIITPYFEKLTSTKIPIIQE